MENQILFIEAFFERLEKNHITYGILRNVDEVTMGIAHDIDMTIDNDKLVDAETILFDIADKMGWSLHLKTGRANDPDNIKSYHFFYIEKQQTRIVHIDFFPTFAWNGYILLDNKTLLNGIEDKKIYHRVAPEIEAVTKLFIRLLYNGYIKSKYKEFIHGVFCDRETQVRSVMSEFLNSGGTNYIIECVKEETWSSIEESRELIVKEIQKKAKHSFIRQKLYLIDKAMKKAGIMVAFEGTDGSGKSTIINCLPEKLGNTFPKGMQHYYHWRPCFIKYMKYPTSENKMEAVIPHAKSCHGKIKSFVKFMLINLDYILGYWCKVRWQIAKGHLVIFDRYYYDYYLDKLRYRLNLPDKVIDAFRWMIPKPDITFLLIGDAQVLYERKKEISVQEIQKQIDMLLHKKNNFHNFIIVDVNQSIEKVVQQISEEILLFGASRYKI